MRALETCFLIVIHKKYGKILVEGDSQLQIQVIKKLTSRSKPNQGSQHWCVVANIQSITSMVIIPILIPLYVKSNANKLVKNSQKKRFS